MSELFKVSQSKVKLYRRCHQAYHYKYFEKLRKKRKSRPLHFGTIIHNMMEAEANADDPFAELKKISVKDQKLFAAEKEMYGELIEDIGVIMREYFDYWDPNALRFIRKNGKSAEHEFKIEVEDGLLFNGKIDAAAKTPNNLKWLVENKSFGKQLPDEDSRWRNIQSVSYFRAMDMLGWFPNVSGVMWNYVCSKPPSKPKINKDGTISKAAISTLPSVVRAFLKENGFNEKKYKDMIIKAENNQKNYFQRIFTPINKPLVDFIFAGFLDTAREMMQYHGKKQDMNIDLHCKWCDYEPLCRAKLTGSDVDFIIEREYTHGNEEQEQQDETEARISE